MGEAETNSREVVVRPGQPVRLVARAAPWLEVRLLDVGPLCSPEVGISLKHDWRHLQTGDLLPSEELRLLVSSGWRIPRAGVLEGCGSKGRGRREWADRQGITAAARPRLPLEVRVCTRDGGRLDAGGWELRLRCTRPDPDYAEVTWAPARASLQQLAHLVAGDEKAGCPPRAGGSTSGDLFHGYDEDRGRPGAALPVEGDVARLTLNRASDGGLRAPFLFSPQPVAGDGFDISVELVRRSGGAPVATLQLPPIVLWHELRVAFVAEVLRPGDPYPVAWDTVKQAFAAACIEMDVQPADRIPISEELWRSTVRTLLDDEGYSDIPEDAWQYGRWLLPYYDFVSGEVLPADTMAVYDRPAWARNAGIAEDLGEALDRRLAAAAAREYLRRGMGRPEDLPHAGVQIVIAPSFHPLSRSLRGVCQGDGVIAVFHDDDRVPAAVSATLVHELGHYFLLRHAWTDIGVVRGSRERLARRSPRHGSYVHDHPRDQAPQCVMGYTAAYHPQFCAICNLQLRFWRRSAILEHPGVKRYLNGLWQGGWTIRRLDDVQGPTLTLGDLPPTLVLDRRSDPVQLGLLHRADASSRWLIDVTDDASWTSSKPHTVAMDRESPGRLVAGADAGQSVRIGASWAGVGEAAARVSVYRKVCHLLLLGQTMGVTGPLANVLISAHDAGQSDARLGQGVTDQHGRVTLWLEGGVEADPDLWFRMVCTNRPLPRIAGRPIPESWSGRQAALREYPATELGSPEAPFIVTIPF